MATIQQNKIFFTDYLKFMIQNSIVVKNNVFFSKVTAPTLTVQMLFLSGILK